MLKKPRNLDVRPREYLTEDEIDRLIKAARQCGRHPHRDATMILVGYIHGFRVSELLNLKWTQINFETAQMNVHRLKGGKNSVHPIIAREIRALRRLQKESGRNPYVFISEYKAPLTPSTFLKIMQRGGEKADFEFPLHPHMLRHSTGFKLANDGYPTRLIQEYLGHKNIQHAVRYTDLLSDKFNGIMESRVFRAS